MLKPPIKVKMILTTCAACAKPIEHDAPARCVACETRYCSDRCLRYHAHRGGHDDECEEIANGGGAEQHHANKKYEETVADAVEECAEDTEGQTCFICMDGDAEEGLVRGCSCRGASGFVHVSCLARQAKILVEEADERDSDDNQWHRWYKCSLCEQQYHGVVRSALSWACWKTYLGRPETDWARTCAMTQLGNALHDAKHYEEALSVKEAVLSMQQRLGASEKNVLITQGNLACTYELVGRLEEALSMERDVYSGRLRLNGEEHIHSLMAANNYANGLLTLQRYAEAKALMRKTIPLARRVLGESDTLNFKMRKICATALYEDPAATRGELREATTTLEDLERTTRRVLGGAHPLVLAIERNLDESREMFYARGQP